MSNTSKVAEERIVAIVLAGKWVKGLGHEVCFAKEGEQGYYSSGDDPSGGAAPWYWGDGVNETISLEKAQDTADEYNERRGISKKDAAKIVAASMRDSIRKTSLIDRERVRMEQDVPEYAGCIPYRSLFSLFDYVISGQGPGGFLEAVLANDLNKSLTKADGEWTLEQLRALTTYIYNHLPDECWKYQAKVDAWKKAGGKVGQGWLKA